MIYDGADVKYLLEKKGFSFSDVARQLDVTPQTVYHVARGIIKSKRVVQHIEKLLDMAPGSLEISREKRNDLVKVA